MTYPGFEGESDIYCISFPRIDCLGLGTYIKTCQILLSDFLSGEKKTVLGGFAYGI